MAWKGAGGVEESERRDEMELVMAKPLVLPGPGLEERVGGPEFRPLRTAEDAVRIGLLCNDIEGGWPTLGVLGGLQKRSFATPDVARLLAGSLLEATD